MRIFVAGCGYDGATLPEIAEALRHPTEDRHYYPNEISGRRTELVREEKMFESGRQRGGAEVLVARRDWCNGSAK